MISPLILLLLPLLATIALLSRWRGPAVARLIIAGFAVATLDLATGSLVPGELVAWAGRGGSHSMFVSLSSGIAIGGLGLWSRRGWLWWGPALPLALGLLVVFWSVLQWLPLAFGAVCGAVPLLLASAMPPRVLPVAAPPMVPSRKSDWYLMALALAAATSNRLMLVLLAPVLPLLDRSSRQDPPGRRRMLLPVLATLVLVALVAYAISLGGTTAVLTAFGFEPPLIGAVERVTGASVLAVAVLMVAPWPLHRFGPGIVLVPAAAALVYRVSGSIAPLGISGWLPLVAMLLVPSAIFAAWRGHWTTALGSVALLAAPRPGWQGMSLLLLIVVTLPLVSAGNPRQPDRISFPEAGYAATLLGACLALGTAAMLAHEVVLGSLLAAGLACAAARPARRPPPA